MTVHMFLALLSLQVHFVLVATTLPFPMFAQIAVPPYVENPVK